MANSKDASPRSSRGGCDQPHVPGEDRSSPDCNCRSANTGRQAFPLGETKAWPVPSSAVVDHGECRNFVVGADGKVEYRLVKTGKTFGSQVEILSGLTAGRRLPFPRSIALRDGARVEGL